MNNIKLLHGLSLAIIVCTIRSLYASDIIQPLLPEEQIELQQQAAEEEQELAQAAQAIEQHVNSLSPEEQEEFWSAVNEPNIPEPIDHMFISIEKTNNDITFITIKLGYKQFIEGTYVSGYKTGKVTLSAYHPLPSLTEVKDPTFFPQAKAIIQNIPDTYFTEEPEMKYVELSFWETSLGGYKQVPTGRLLWQTKSLPVVPGTWQENLYTLALNEHMKASKNELPQWTWIDTLKSFFGK
ncbi:MAG TPA: hypothetical protein VGW78_07300 [Candidatus Babeliales bacterium]|jgi:hypothetical protein|nr:hypothetical protein [Candidatus Babeliales bacterium]